MTLAVTPRDLTTDIADLRAKGLVPAVVYGPKQEPLPIAVDAIQFEKCSREAGESTIITLAGLAEPVETLIKDVVFHPVKPHVDHVDFYAIERGKDLSATVALEFVGESPAEKSNLGTVTKVLHEVTVTCRPSNLPSQIEVDLSRLASVDDRILIQDIDTLEGVRIEAGPEDMVAMVSAAREETEDEAEANAAVDMDTIEVEQKGKGEDADAETTS